MGKDVLERCTYSTFCHIKKLFFFSRLTIASENSDWFQRLKHQRLGDFSKLC